MCELSYIPKAFLRLRRSWARFEPPGPESEPGGRSQRRRFTLPEWSILVLFSSPVGGGTLRSWSAASNSHILWPGGYKAHPWRVKCTNSTHSQGMFASLVSKMYEFLHIPKAFLHLWRIKCANSYTFPKHFCISGE